MGKVYFDTLDEIFPDFKKFIDKYYEDGALPHALDVDWIGLEQMAEAIVCFTVIKNNDIVGVNAFHVYEDIKDKDSILADNLVFLVRKEFRKSFSFLLIEQSKNMLKKKGVNKVNYLLYKNHQKPLIRLLQQKGYEEDMVKLSWAC